MKVSLTLAALIAICALLQVWAQTSDAPQSTRNPIALRNAKPTEARARGFRNYGYYDDPCCYNPNAHYECQNLCCDYAYMSNGVCIDYACYCY